MQPVYIHSYGSVTPLGGDVADNWRTWVEGRCPLRWLEELGPAGTVPESVASRLEEMAGQPGWRDWDRCTLLGVMAAREALPAAWRGSAGLGIVTGTSRGAMASLERELDRHLAGKRVATKTSPTTTQSALADAVARDLQACGPHFNVSSACASGLQAIGTAVALIQAGQAAHVVAGAAEAPLTSFGRAMLAECRVLAKQPSALYPCRPFHPARSGMVPGEGAAFIGLSESIPEVQTEQPMIAVVGYGAASEQAGLTGVSPQADALQSAIQRALLSAGLAAGDVDLVVTHGAGTALGDARELAAYEQIFDSSRTGLTCLKWMSGHMLGASSAHSVVMAAQALRHGVVPAIAYGDGEEPAWLRRSISNPRMAMVTALGFGGAASALVIKSMA